MKLMVSGKSISLSLLRYVGIGPVYAPTLVFFQVLGNSQAVRGIKYILTRKQSQELDLYTPKHYGSIAYLARGNWRVEVKPHQVQGLTLHLLTAYLPFGTWGYNGERYFFVTPGEPGPQHDPLLRRWANEFTPYPIPPTLSVMALLGRARLKYGGGFENSNDEAPVLVGEGMALGETPAPWALAITPETFEEILKEVSRAS